MSIQNEINRFAENTVNEDARFAEQYACEDFTMFQAIVDGEELVININANGAHDLVMGSVMFARSTAYAADAAKANILENFRAALG